MGRRPKIPKLAGSFKARAHRDVSDGQVLKYTAGDVYFRFCGAQVRVLIDQETKLKCFKYGGIYHYTSVLNPEASLEQLEAASKASKK